MTEPQWLLQRNHPNIGSIREIVRILREQDLDVFEVDLVPRSAEIPFVDGMDETRPTVCYGPSFVPRAFGCPEFDPGIFFDPEAFRWSSFAANWPGLMLSDGYPKTVDEALDADFATVFARPDADSKSFDGGLYQHRGLEEALRGAQSRGLLSDSDLLLSTTLGTVGRNEVHDQEADCGKDENAAGEKLPRYAFRRERRPDHPEPAHHRGKARAFDPGVCRRNLLSPRKVRVQARPKGAEQRPDDLEKDEAGEHSQYDDVITPMVAKPADPNSKPFKARARMRLSHRSASWPPRPDKKIICATNVADTNDDIASACVFAIEASTRKTSAFFRKVELKAVRKCAAASGAKRLSVISMSVNLPERGPKD